MKLKKMFVFLILFFIGVISPKAMDYNALYNNYEQYYRVLGTLTYYYNYSAGYATFGDNVDNALIDGLYKFQPFPTIQDLNERQQKLRTIYDAGFGNGSNTASLVRTMTDILKQNGLLDLTDADVKDTIDNNYFNKLITYKNLPEMLNYTRLCMKNIADNSNFSVQYDELIEQTKNAYSNFCDYLKNHKGVSYYITNILKIVSYVVLGLAIILGGIDFVGAILSNEDNALQKAFQKFVRRLIAAVLVFLAYIIVQVFIGLVTSFPGVDVANTEICEELKIGTFK